MELCFEYNKDCSYDQRKVMLALISLKGGAEAWAHSAQFSKNKKTTWKDFCVQIITRFGPLGDDAVALQGLVNLKQQATETVTQYTLRFRELMLQAHVEREELYLPQFVCGLRADIRKHCIISAPSSFEDCVTVAIRAEHANQNLVEDTVANEQENLLRQILSLVQSTQGVRQQPRITTPYRGPDRGGGSQQDRARGYFCNLCKSYGHSPADCPTRRPSTSTNPTPNLFAPQTHPAMALNSEVQQNAEQGAVAEQFPAQFGAVKEMSEMSEIQEIEDPCEPTEGHAEASEMQETEVEEKVPGRLLEMMCAVNGVEVHAVLIDPGSAKSVMDTQCIGYFRTRLIPHKKKTVLEMANGSTISTPGRTDNCVVNVAGAVVELECFLLDAHGSYQLLLGQDFLYKTSACSDHRNGHTVLRTESLTILVTNYNKAIQLLGILPTQTDPDDPLHRLEVLPDSINAQAGYHLQPCAGLSVRELMTDQAREERVLNEINVNPELSNDQRRCVEELLRRYAGVFAFELEDLSQATDLVEHPIDISPSSVPKYQVRGRRLSVPEMKFVEEEVSRLLEAGIIEESNSPWASPVVVVPKGSSYRLCVNYANVNRCTQPIHYPLPDIVEMLEKLASHRHFSALDGYSGYFTIPVRPKDRPFTQFVCALGTFQFKRLPFGLYGAPMTYSRFVAKAFRSMTPNKVVVYLDDVCVMSDDFGLHLRDLEEALQLASRAQFKLKASKCFIGFTKLKFLGHVVSAGSIEVQAEKVEKVRSWPSLNNVSEIRRFIGFCSYYRRFVENFAAKAEPLIRLTRKKIPWSWTTEQEEAMKQLKEDITTAPCIAAPDPNRPFVLETDACGTGISGVLSQYAADGSLHPVYFYSRGLTSAETRYSVTELECLAVVASLKKLRHYVAGQRIEVFTDHSAVIQILKTKMDAPARLLRWQLQLSEFNLTFSYRKGAKHVVADALSRAPQVEVEDEMDLDESGTPVTFEGTVSGVPSEMTETSSSVIQIPLRSLAEDPPTNEETEGAGGDEAQESVQARSRSLAELIAAILTSRQASMALPRPLETVGDVVEDREADEGPSDERNDLPDKSAILQELLHGTQAVPALRSIFEDPQYSDLIEYLVHGTLPTDPQAKRNLQLRATRFHILDGILYFKDGDLNWKVVPHRDDTAQLIKEAHEGIGGHLGRAATLFKLRRFYWWKSMFRDIEQAVRRCPTCQRWSPRPSKQSMLHPYECVSPFSVVFLDWIGPLPQSRRGRSYIITLVDGFSRYVEAKSYSSCSSVQSRHFMLKMMMRYSPPLIAVTDGGAHFLGSFDELLSRMSVKHVTTAPYHPQSAGAVERANGLILQRLRKWAADTPEVWDDMLPAALISLNARRTPRHRFSPQEILMGISFRGRAETQILNHQLEHQLQQLCQVDQFEGSEEAFVARLLMMESVRDEATLRTQKAARKTADHYNRNVHEITVMVGDLVLIRERRRGGVGGKFGKKWRGPFLVSWVGDYGIAEVQLERGSVLVPIDHLKLWFD